MKDELIFRVWSESVSYGDALEPEKILKFARAIELLSASEPAMAMPEEVRHALTHAIGGWRGAACGTRDDEEGERRSADYRRRAQVIEDWLAASTAAPAQSYWTKEQVAAVREDAKRLHAKLTPGKLVDDAPAKSGEPVYQIEQSNGSWLDVSSDAYESTEDYRRRIVYTAPHPSPTAVVLVDERSAFEVWWQALPTETNPQDCDTSYEADVKGWALMAWQARAVSPQPVEQTRALPRYTEWLYLREHGQWSNGVPDWARDHFGHMNDFTAASAVIEELACAARPASGETETEQPSPRCPEGGKCTGNCDHCRT